MTIGWVGLPEPVPIMWVRAHHERLAAAIVELHPAVRDGAVDIVSGVIRVQVATALTTLKARRLVALAVAEYTVAVVGEGAPVHVLVDGIRLWPA